MYIRKKYKLVLKKNLSLNDDVKDNIQGGINF